ncbi:MAG: sigma-54-dependent Fis family transcriptional regulator [Oxalobacteraceae bacterium]|nr:sigma-54-dependent Fis family transcriptional regulator [Oxalobacteraceae bacterium]
MRPDTRLRHYRSLYGNSGAMDLLYTQIRQVARTEATVLLEGESGTGKELIAMAIHQDSPRCDANFVAVNCGAIPAALIESVLFGHEKGSFTGAGSQHTGYFEHASGGTLFLDEITEMPANMQVKLLRILECGRFHRVGGSQEIAVDVRLIAATNRSLQEAVNEGFLRQDLMYRLAVFPITVPPLRERGNDAELLAQHFLDDLNNRAGTRKQFSRRSLERIRSYHWPGNVRELKNLVHRAYILSAGAVTLHEPTDASRRPTALINGVLNFMVGTRLVDAQREIILATLKHFQGNKRKAAEILGISLKTLYNRLREY